MMRMMTLRQLPLLGCDEREKETVLWNARDRYPLDRLTNRRGFVQAGRKFLVFLDWMFRIQ